MNQKPVGSIYHNLWYLTGEDDTWPFFSLSGWNEIRITSRLLIIELHSYCLWAVVQTWICWLSYVTHCTVYFFCSIVVEAEAGYGHCSCFKRFLVSFWTISFITVEFPHLHLQYSYFRYQQSVFLMNECGYTIKIGALLSSFYFHH